MPRWPNSVPLRAITPGAAVLAGIGYAVQSLSYGLGSIAEPGPGAVPLFAGLALAVCGIAVVATDLAGSGETDNAALAPEDAPHESHGFYRPRFPAAVTLCGVVLLVAIVLWQANIVGLLVATAVLVGVCALLMAVKPLTAFVTGLAFYGCAYVIFEYWLSVPLPHGYF